MELRKLGEYVEEARKAGIDIGTVICNNRWRDPRNGDSTIRIVKYDEDTQLAHRVQFEKDRGTHELEPKKLSDILEYVEVNTL